uniref:Nuclear protein localization protein 4 homolog n=1 Tax=Oncorhynchus kisutch TaxID=8019 RepID=A0A8C7FEG7_ONCKI
VIIRVQSPNGMKKIPATKKETAAAFLNKVGKEFGFPSNGFTIFLNRNKTDEIQSQNKTLSLLKIKHGDMLYLYPSGSPGPAGETMDLDEIDQYLAKQEGKIYRNKDPQLCRHGSMGKCVHCVPLEPFDEEYLSHLEPPVKHMSFHAYIRKLTGGADKGKFVALENISCKIKSGCEGHPPWPEGICTKCQPSAITLNRQKYRHIDNIMFENHTIADRFLDFWRKTGSQRMGYLYGRYTEHKDIPLAIRAEVAAIYEPPQIATQNSLELVEDPKAAAVEEIAAKLGLRKVGWIFTDLLSEDTRIGTVKYTRNKDSYFLSAEECITAGHFQNQQCNPCRLSPDGHFGSKFITVVATGGPDNQVHFEGYQVSNQCMALVRDECLLPCRDAPELGYAKESSTEQYVPDVFYKITTTFPKDPQYTFSSTPRFPIENRDILGETQDFHSLATYLSQCTSTVFLDMVSDFHLLLFLVTNEVMPLRDSIGLLLDAVKTKDEELAQTWKKSEQWATIEQLCSKYLWPSRSTGPWAAAQSSVRCAACRGVKPHPLPWPPCFPNTSTHPLPSSTNDFAPGLDTANSCVIGCLLLPPPLVHSISDCCGVDKRKTMVFVYTKSNDLTNNDCALISLTRSLPWPLTETGWDMFS